MPTPRSARVGVATLTSWKVQCRSPDSAIAVHCSLTSPLTNRAWDEILQGLGLGYGLRTRLPVYHRHIMLKMYLLFPHNAQCFLVPIGLFHFISIHPPRKSVNYVGGVNNGQKLMCPRGASSNHKLCPGGSGLKHK